MPDRSQIEERTNEQDRTQAKLTAPEYERAAGIDDGPSLRD